MIVADILMWFLLIMGTYIIFISYWLAAQALFPELTDRCRQRIKAAPVKQALIGLAWTIPAEFVCFSRSWGELFRFSSNASL